MQSVLGAAAFLHDRERHPPQSILSRRGRTGRPFSQTGKIQNASETAQSHFKARAPYYNLVEL